jgi:hypothetical protein
MIGIQTHVSHQGLLISIQSFIRCILLIIEHIDAVDSENVGI